MKSGGVCGDMPGILGANSYYFLRNSRGRVSQGRGTGTSEPCPYCFVLKARSQTGCSLGYTDYRSSPTCNLHPQGLCWPPAPAGTELQGETPGSTWGPEVAREVGTFPQPVGRWCL